jgi:hypothetical protein|tara:strand:+ start:818 stop:946 length:129 start_codon:yes stop_codon:yes gene_type:complete
MADYYKGSPYKDVRNYKNGKGKKKKPEYKQLSLPLNHGVNEV